MGRVLPRAVIVAAALACGAAGLSSALAPAAPAAGSAGAPVLDKSFVATPLSGVVLIRRTAGAAYTTLDRPVLLPFGSTVDASGGKIGLTSARNGAGATQTGQFSGGRFQVTQVSGKTLQSKGRVVAITRLALIGPLCTATTASAGRSRPRRHRHVWGTDSGGTWRTVGYHATATAVHTKWLTEDLCNGTTRVKVVRGTVDVYCAATLRGTADSADPGLSKKVLQTLVAVHHGFFRTCGRYSAATVRGAPDTAAAPVPPPS
jgi:hypothetical protein